MRAAILAAGLAAAGIAPAHAFEQKDQRESSATIPVAAVSQAFSATAPENADPARAYDTPDDALLEADLDYLARAAADRGPEDDEANLWTVVRFFDAFAAGRYAEARAALIAAPNGGLSSATSDAFEPFLIAAEGNVDLAVERVDHGLDELPDPLPEVARALLFESAGRLEEAAAVYAHMEHYLDLTPPSDDEPDTPEEFRRSLNAARITHAMYRAALVQHRLGRAEQARRLYGVVEAFAPRSADVAENVRRLERGEGPLEPQLNLNSAAGRWLTFVSEFVTQSETLSRLIANPEPIDGLPSTMGTLFLQLGVALSPDAQDWRLYAANELTNAGGYDGALRLLAGMQPDGVFAADTEIARADIHLNRHEDAEAVAASERALALAGERWTIVAAAGEVFRSTGQNRRSIEAFSRALSMVDSDKDRADVLAWRAYAHRFAGDIGAASADMRQALALDRSDDTRLQYVSIMMDSPRGWADGIRVARELFAEQPDSVTRLNALGYALIQRPEGLEEGYRLLWRGFNYGQADFAVIDSLGWAYYLHGRFEEAQALIERADALTGEDRNPEILDHLGDVYWRLGRRDDAREAWRAGLDFRPDALRRDALERKVRSGLREAAPRRIPLPTVTLPDGPAQRGDT